MNLTDIFNSFYEKIYSFVLFRVGNVQDAEDITSTVFVKVAEKIDMYNPQKGAFSTWIFTIAKNETKTHFRNKKNTVPLDGIGEIVCQFNIEKNLLRQDEYVNLYEAINELNDNQKEALLLKYFGGLSNKEIAKLLELSETNTGFILHSARRILRDYIESSKLQKVSST